MYRPMDKRRLIFVSTDWIIQHDICTDGVRHGTTATKEKINHFITEAIQFDLPFVLFAVPPIHRRWWQFCPFVPNDFPCAATTFQSQDVSLRSYKIQIIINIIDWLLSEWMWYTYRCESPSMFDNWDFRWRTLCDVSSQCSRKRFTAKRHKR